MDKHVIYALPGLGADRRMFSYQLQLDYDWRFVDWIAPIKGESMTEYAKRYSGLFDTSRPFSILGVSLGGMMCMEVAKYIDPEQVILVSSCKTANELPTQLRALRKAKLHKLINARILKQMIKFYSNTVGDLSGELKYLFNHMVENSDPDFMMWAANAVITWDNTDIPDHVVHIHGSKDKVLQYQFVHPDYTVDGGSHYMIGTRVHEVNALLDKVLSRVPTFSKSNNN